MVKYLNNRRNKSRTARKQDTETQNTNQADQSATGQRDSGGNQEQGQYVPQDHPAMAMVHKSWQMIKGLLTYQPTEFDDSFSLGGRRTQGNPGPSGENQGSSGEGDSTGHGEQGSQTGDKSDQAVTQGQPQSGQAAGSTKQPNGNKGRNKNQGNKEQGNQDQGNSGQANKGQGQDGQGSKEQTNSDQGSDAGKQQEAGQQGQDDAGPQRTANTPPPGTAPYYQMQKGEQQGPQGGQGQQGKNLGNRQGEKKQKQGSNQGGSGSKVEHTQQGGTPPGEKPVPVEQQVHYSLEKNLEHVKRVFHIPKNKGFTIREFVVDLVPPRSAFVVFTEGLADKNIIDNYVLEPLMVLGGLEDYSPGDPLALAKERLVSANQVEEKKNFIEVVEGVLSGSTALFIDGSNACLLMETKGWEHRAIGSPKVENVVRGPQEGFNEVLISNIALVRSRLRTENLVSEMFKVGKLSRADVSVMYLRDIANPAIVDEVRKRIKALKQVDYIPDTGILEQFIEDNPYSPMPQMLSTERPDRVASYLSEGYVAILMSSTPFALIVPVTFWALLHSAEDTYVRWPYGGFMRLVRVIALLAAMLLPAFYIAIINYHHAMLPTGLLFAIAAARERVPMPAVLEIVLMELSFELIREAGIRIPSIIGATIGIVGALILGQAAVQANLISPLVIIIVALTGLSSFAIPNYNLSFQVRIMRFIYLGAATLGGFVTITVVMFIHMTSLNTVKSFGVPILSPAAPNRPSKDTIMRAPIWLQEKRSNLVRPLKKQRQPEISRAWSPKALRRRGGQND